jgi:hypothetical protein
MITVIIISVICLLIASAANAVMDTLAHHYSSSIFTRYNPLFWNPVESWKNKYKNGDPEQGAKFTGSTTIFVLFTDAWHLFKFIQINSYLIAVILPAWLWSGTEWWFGLIGFVVVKILQGIVFNILYHKLFLL